MQKMITILALTALIAVAGSALAQSPSVGLYFDTDGLNSTAVLNGGNDEFYDAYILAFSDRSIDGAAFMLDIFPDIELLNVAYPGGSAIGDLKTGVEISLDSPALGAPQPVVLAELTLFTGLNLVYYGRLNTVPHPDLPFVALTPAGEAPAPAEGTCAWLTVPVDEQKTSWGGVKTLYR